MTRLGNLAAKKHVEIKPQALYHKKSEVAEKDEDAGGFAVALTQEQQERLKQFEVDQSEGRHDGKSQRSERDAEAVDQEQINEIKVKENELQEI